MKNLLIVFYFLGTFSANSQAPTILWQHNYGSPGTDQCRGLFPMPDGGFIAIGGANQNGGDVTGHHGINDVWTIRIDSSGNLLWQKCFGGTNAEAGDEIILNSLNQIIILGITTSNDGDVTGNHGGMDVWIVKADTAGNLIDQKCFGGSANDFGTSLVQTTDGGYIISGITRSDNGDVSGQHGAEDAWLLKVDSLFNLEWQHCYGGTSLDGFKKVIQTLDGNYLGTGYSYSTNGDITDHRGDTLYPDAWIVKADTIGNLMWQKSFGGSDDDFGEATIETAINEFLFVGTTFSNDSDVTANHSSGWYCDIWLVKFDNTNGIEWEKCLGGNSSENGIALYQGIDKNITIFGGAASNNNGDVGAGHGSNDYWLLRTDSIGNVLWNKCFGGTTLDHAWEFSLINDTTYLLGGWSSSTDGDITNNIGVEDYWLVKASYTTATQLEEFNAEQMLLVYPSPATTYFNIDLTGYDDKTEITICDIAGSIIYKTTTIANQKVEINSSEFAEGIYLVQIQSADFLTTQMLVVTK